MSDELERLLLSEEEEEQGKKEEIKKAEEEAEKKIKEIMEESKKLELPVEEEKAEETLEELVSTGKPEPHKQPVKPTTREEAGKPGVETIISTPAEEEKKALKEFVEGSPRSTTIREPYGIVFPAELKMKLEEIPEPVEEKEEEMKYVIVIAGDKGVGKTVNALSLPGTIAVLSFDHKSLPIKIHFYNNDPRIHVFNVRKYFQPYSRELLLKSAYITYLYTLKVLDYVSRELKPDWIVLDNMELAVDLCEMVMRYQYGYDPYQGIRELTRWKLRKRLLETLIDKSYNIARRGIVATVFTDYEEIIVDGEVTQRKKVPKWVEHLVFIADIIVMLEKADKTRKFYATVLSSKYDNILPTGTTFDVTDKPLFKQIKL